MEKKKLEKKFWNQSTFWFFVGIEIVAILSLPIFIVSSIMKITSLFLPMTLSTLDIWTVVFLILVASSTWSKIRKYMKQAIAALIAVTILLIIKEPSFTITNNVGIKVIVSSLSYLAVITLLVWWVKKCFEQVGTAEVPCQAGLFRFGKPIQVVGPGLYFRLFPFEKFKKVPMGQYNFNYTIKDGLYSIKRGNLASQPMVVNIAVYLRFPQVSHKYSFPTIKDDGTIVWEDQQGEVLLLKLLKRMPVKDFLTPEADAFIGEHLKEAVLGAVRHEMSLMTSEECSQQKQRIEDEVKRILLTGQGDPCFECGIPEECLDLLLTSVKLPDETEQAYIKPEIALKGAEAAMHEKDTIQTLVGALVEEGVNPNVAALVVGGKIKGEGLDLSQLRDLIISSGAYGAGLFQPKTLPESKSPSTKSEIILT